MAKSQGKSGGSQGGGGRGTTSFHEHLCADCRQVVVCTLDCNAEQDGDQDRCIECVNKRFDAIGEDMMSTLHQLDGREELLRRIATVQAVVEQGQADSIAIVATLRDGSVMQAFCLSTTARDGCLWALVGAIEDTKMRIFDEGTDEKDDDE